MWGTWRSWLKKKPPRRSVTLTKPWVILVEPCQSSELQNCKIINSYCSKPLNLCPSITTATIESWHNFNIFTLFFFYFLSFKNNFISVLKELTQFHFFQGTCKSLLQHHSSKASIIQRSAFFLVQLSHPYMTTGKTIALTRWTFVGKVMALLFNMLSRS